MSNQEQQHFDTSGADVSRETLSHREPEKTEATDEITPEQQMLYDIIDRSMAKSQERQAGENTEDPAPPREEPEQEQQDSPPPPQKNKPSSFYVYLAVLFGAAFLMLLLAYFVQQRNNATAMDDLRMTSNASREELLEEIKQLEADKDALQKDWERIQNKVNKTNERLKAQEAEAKDWMERYAREATGRERAVALSCLERFLNEKDYLMAACVAADCDHLFNPSNGMYSPEPSPLPAQTDRYLELRGRLEEKGHLLIYQYSQQDSGNYTEIPTVAQGQEVNTTQERKDAAISARNLWPIFYYYLKEDPEVAAMLTAGFYNSELGNNFEYLNTKTFQSSTLSLFEQIKADLMEQGRLVETENGLQYAENGNPVDIRISIPE